MGLMVLQSETVAELFVATNEYHTEFGPWMPRQLNGSFGSIEAKALVPSVTLPQVIAIASAQLSLSGGDASQGMQLSVAEYSAGPGTPPKVWGPAQTTQEPAGRHWEMRPEGPAGPVRAWRMAAPVEQSAPGPAWMMKISQSKQA